MPDGTLINLDFPNENQSIWLTQIGSGRERGVSMLTGWTRVASSHHLSFLR